MIVSHPEKELSFTQELSVAPDDASVGCFAKSDIRYADEFRQEN